MARLWLYTDEALSVHWLTTEEVRQRMDPTYVVRVTDAFTDRASARAHDGVNLLHVDHKRCFKFPM